MPGAPFEEELEARRLRFQRRHEDACVPRRFGLGTLMVVATAYAVLFGVLRGLHAPWQITVGVGGFLTIVGVVQMFAGPKHARRASLLLGCAVVGLVAVILSFMNGLSPRVMSVLAFFALIVGGLFGYVAGVVVASVFLFINLANRWSDKHLQEP